MPNEDFTPSVIHLASAGQPAARWWRPEKKPFGTFVIFHGVKSNGGWFAPFARELVARGFAVLAPDRRGSGLNRDVSGRDDPSAWTGDVEAALELGAKEGGGEAAPLAWCWGARQLLAAVADGVAVRTAFFLVPALRPSAEVHEKRASVDRLEGDMLPLPFGDDLFSDDPDVVSFIRSDASAWKREPRAFRRESVELAPKVEEGLRRLQGPAYALLADGDRIADTPAVHALFETNPAVTIDHVEGGHAIAMEQPALVAERVTTFWRHQR